jgi:type I restriction enzyme S subunit
MTDLPRGWEWTTIGEVSDVQLGRQRSPKNHVGPHMRPYLRSANVTWSGLDLSDVKEMNFDPAEADAFELQPGDLLLNEASGSPNEVGKPAIWRGEIDGCCFQNTLLRARPHAVRGPYLYWYCRSAALAGLFGEAGRGVNIRHLGKSALVSFPLPLPPWAEQDRIVAAIEEHLSRLDAAEGAVGGATRKVHGLKKSVLAQAQAEGNEVALDDLLVDIETGKSFKTPGRPAEGHEWGVIKVSAMTWGEFDEAENKAVPADQHVDPRHEIRSGDLLLSRANTSEYVGASVLVGECRPRLLLSDKSMRLLTVSGVDRRWLHYALRAPQVRSQMSRVATGTSDSMRNISQSKVRALRVRVPTLGRQEAIAAQVEDALMKCRQLEVEAKTVRARTGAARRSILAAAFSGKLVPQDPADEPASVLLERIRGEREARDAAAPKRRSRSKSKAKQK